MSEAVPNEGDILRKVLFVPMASKESLHTWIQVYLGLNMPDQIVDPDSNSSPMDMIWEIYHKALANNDEDFSRVMAYASRDSMKTLGAAVLEVLMLLHLDRDIIHMAAIKDQSEKAQEYVKGFFRLPYLRDFVVGDNKSEVVIVRYYNDATGDSLNTEQYKNLLEQEKSAFREIRRYVRIVVCTLQSTNGQHAPFFVVDEVDVVPKQHRQAYQEAKSIPAIRDGWEPITLLTSTRKFAWANVQQELNEASKTGLVVRHWNIIDVTERCPASRHLPHLPKIQIYHSPDLLEATDETGFKKLTPEQQSKWQVNEGYQGCLSKCKLFAMCRGHLATRQKDHPKKVNSRNGKEEWVEKPAPLLKSIPFTTNKFRQLPLDMAKAQLLCWKPSLEGLIYPYLDREKHVITAANIANKVTGEGYDPATFGVNELFALLLAREVKWVAGVDFGFSHNFAVVLMAVDGNRAFVVGCWSQPELDPAEKIDLLDRTIKQYEPIIYPDMASPDMVKFLKKKGYRVREWDKGPGSVIGGIEAVRYKIRTGLGDPGLFFLKGDSGCEVLFDRLSLYHWALGNDGKPTNEPDEEVTDGVGDDECDALRYAVMNTFKNAGKVVVSEDPVKIPTPVQVITVQETNRQQQASWAKQMLDHAFGGTSSLEELQSEEPGQSGSKGRKGGFFWDI